MSTIFSRDRHKSQLLKYITPYRFHKEFLALDCGKKRKYFPIKYIEYRYSINNYITSIIENMNIVKEIRVRQETVNNKVFEALDNAIINISLLIDTITEYIMIRNLAKLANESKTKAKILRKFEHMLEIFIEYRSDLVKYNKNLKAKFKKDNKS